MRPTLGDGALVISMQRPLWTWTQKTFLRGEVYHFTLPVRPGQIFVKRLVGLPGETLWIENGQLWINDRPLDGILISRSGRDPIDCLYSEKFEIPPDSVFLMGDNLCESFDSRYFGAVPSSQLRGQVVARIFKGRTL